MSTPAQRNLVPSVRIDVDMLSVLPLPAFIFNMNDAAVVQSNSFFSQEANISVITLLQRFNYRFFTKNDIVILTHRLRKEEKICTQRIIQSDSHIKSFEIYLSLIPNSELALLFFIENRKPVNDTKADFLKDILQGISEGIGVVNAKNTVTFCNRSFASLFGKEEKHIIGENILKLVDKQNKPILEAEIENQRGFLDSTFELESKTLDGQGRYILIHAIPKTDSDGKYSGSLFTTIDISDRVLMERELVYNKDKAQESDRLKSTFLANMSHEIRTPMNSVIGFSSMLLRGGLDKKKQDQYLNIVINRGKHLMQILDDIIDITKIEENQIQLNLKTFNLYDLFSELKVYVESELVHSKKDEIKMNVSHGLPRDEATIFADSLRLQQVLTNLLNNAVKFTDAGSINFGYYKEEGSDELVFFVSDTGIGIHPNMHKLIFERFRQVDESFSRSYGGTGLGLTICKGLLQLMGGKIWLKSDGRNGSTFYFSLPLYLYNKEETVIPVVTEKEFNWEGRNILIVEDDPSSYEFLYEILSEKNCKIRYAANAKEALSIFAQYPFDLILLDIQLPEVDGYQIARQIRQINTSIPIIAQTAHAMSDDRQKCIASGCNEYVTKPIQVDHLLETIDSYFLK
jgi:PAS domain S-box-containing protein